MHRRATIKERRQMPGTLDGVTLTTVYAIPTPAGTIAPGEDVTRIAATWPNLPMFLKRGYIKANPPVDWTRLAAHLKDGTKQKPAEKPVDKAPEKSAKKVKP